MKIGIAKELSNDEKISIANMNLELEEKLYNRFLNEIMNKAMDGKVTLDYAKGFRDGLLERIAIIRTYESKVLTKKK